MCIVHPTDGRLLWWLQDRGQHLPQTWHEQVLSGTSMSLFLSSWIFFGLFWTMLFILTANIHEHADTVPWTPACHATFHLSATTGKEYGIVITNKSSILSFWPNDLLLFVSWPDCQTLLSTGNHKGPKQWGAKQQLKTSILSRNK